MTNLSYPALISLPWASGNGPNFGGKNVIPSASASPAASFADGFPNVTMLPLLSGGVPPSGQDMNGIFNAITQHTVWLNGGGWYAFNLTLAMAIGGYGLGAELQSASTPAISWISLCASNSANPDLGPFAITASCSTSVLNVTATAGVLLVGQQITGAGIPAGTTIASLGTGIGGTGTYNLSTTPGTVTSSAMTAFGWQPASGSLPPFLGTVPRTLNQKLSDWVNAKDFGVIGTGVSTPLSGVTSYGLYNTSGWTLPQWQAVFPFATALTNQMDWCALQMAINAAIAGGKKLFIPAGTYVIDQPLMAFVFKAGLFSFFSLHIEGEKSTWDYNVPAAIISPTFNNSPALAVQNGRGVTLKSLVFLGTNNLYGQWGGGSNFNLLMTITSFNLNASQDTQHGPYCAVAVDPFTNASTMPGGGYSSLSAYYVAGANAGGSSNTTFEDCRFENFIVGVQLTATSAQLNNDQVTFNRCFFGFNKVGLSIGQSQNRGIYLNDCQLYFCYYGVDAVSYGNQNGGSLKVKGGLAVGVKYLMNMSSQWQDTALWSGFYAESLASLGFYYGSGATQAALLFSGCSLNFFDWAGGTGPVADQHLVSSGAVLFEGCFISSINCTFPGPMRFANFGSLNFKSCHFSDNIFGELQVAPVYQTTQSCEFCQCYFESCTMSEPLGHGAGLYSNLTHRSVTLANTFEDNETLPFGSIKSYTASGTPGQMFLNGSQLPENVTNLGASVAVTVVANTTKATFTATTPGVIRVGDLIFAIPKISGTYVFFDGPAGPGTANPYYVCIGTVSNIAGSVITINGVPQSLYAAIVANGNTASFQLYSEWWSRSHQASTGNTSTSTTVTSVSAGTWKAGHKIKGSGFPTGTYVTNVATTTFVGTCSFATNQMTLQSTTSGSIHIGDIVTAAGVTPGTYVVSGSGPWTLSTTPGTIATEATSSSGITLTLSQATTSTLVGNRLYDASLYSFTGTPV